MPPELGVAAARGPGIDGAGDTEEEVGDVGGGGFAGKWKDVICRERILKGLWGGGERVVEKEGDESEGGNGEASFEEESD